jgi:hypothetical protein
LRINIVKPELPSLTQIKKEFSRTLNSGKVTNYSKNVILFEKNLKNFFKSKYTPVVFSNGEMALYHLIQAWRYKLKIEDKNDITALVPSFTFSGTINALILNNIKPIFCDIDGTIFVYRKFETYTQTKPEVIPSTLEYLKENGSYKFAELSTLVETGQMSSMGIVSVPSTGLGFMAIKKGVLEKLTYPWFEPYVIEDEDVYDLDNDEISFCKKLRDSNISVYVDSTVIITQDSVQSFFVS